MLGFKINEKSLQIELEQVAAILDWPEPKMLMQVQELVEFINFYHCSIYNIFGIIRPITDLTKKSNKKFK